MKRREKILGWSFVVLWVLLSCNFPQVSTAKPTALIVSPPSGTAVQVGGTVVVEARGACPDGVSRIELWANNALAGRTDAPPGAAPKQFSAKFEWTPAAAGPHVLQARVYCAGGQEAISPLVSLNAVSQQAATTASPPTPTAIPQTPTLPPSPTAATPFLVALDDVNVRTGPATAYPIIGVLHKDQQAIITGKTLDASWWQIVFPLNTAGRGWVSALYVAAQNTAGVPVAQAPPPPTTTPTPIAVAINFWADDTEINAGACTDLHWAVTGGSAVYLDGGAVGPHGSKHVCPASDHTYTLHVVKPDNSTEDRQVTVQVTSHVVPPPVPTFPVIILYPDLKVAAYTVSFPSGPHCGKPWNVHISVTNDGSVAASSFKVWWSVDSQVVREWTVNSLPVGGVWTQNFVHTHSCNQPSDLTTQVKVDPDNSVSESNENNNTSVLHVHITP